MRTGPNPSGLFFDQFGEDSVELVAVLTHDCTQSPAILSGIPRSPMEDIRPFAGDAPTVDIQTVAVLGFLDAAVNHTGALGSTRLLQI